jgi:hypothetical protein
VDTTLELSTVIVAAVMMASVAEEEKGLYHPHPLRVVFLSSSWRSWGIIIVTISTQLE